MLIKMLGKMLEAVVEDLTATKTCHLTENAITDDTLEDNCSGNHPWLLSASNSLCPAANDVSSSIGIGCIYYTERQGRIMATSDSRGMEGTGFGFTQSYHRS